MTLSAAFINSQSIKLCRCKSKVSSLSILNVNPHKSLEEYFSVDFVMLEMMIWLDDMKDSLSLVSVSVCHISSSDDAVIIVPVHCDLLQNTPLAPSQNKHYFNRVVVSGDRKGPGHQHNYNYHVRERERCAESGHQAGSHLSRENIVSQRRIYTPALNISSKAGEATWPGPSFWRLFAGYLVSYVSSHLTPHTSSHH